MSDCPYVAAARGQGQGQEMPKIDDKKTGEAPKEQEEFVDDDSPWYFGKARDEFKRRQSPVSEEEDPIQVGFFLFCRLRTLVDSIFFF
jgi:hypothetical protein